MQERQAACRIQVMPMAPAFTEAAQALASALGLPCGSSTGPSDGEFALQLGPAGLQLQQLGAEAPGPVWVDFLQGGAAHRRQFGGGSGQMIAKAAGLQPGVRPYVLDATAGLGQDAFVLATLGCRVEMIERQPIIAQLLRDGLERARGDAQVGSIVARMRLHQGNAIELLRAWQDEPPQVVYLDPMFPHRDKSALVKKEMRLFRPLVGDDLDAPALLEAALALATHRVTVKRPRKAPPIAGVAPSLTLEGKSSRYDIYPKKSLKA
ncbi:class I SAM-dependent methyltransferase [Pseudomonas sp. RIT-PI-S]|uniref:class I SAM-dependent methyltransferase n=1 Tax=Pseudomonas sp. RIT-PI-S TaxID=3035295 RepID=UPI0021D8209D|nr:class I SAM-dependent methyltransferase [Pseudomonas sp. RIT-PI-S]